jgi:hypothetical protein
MRIKKAEVEFQIAKVQFQKLNLQFQKDKVGFQSAVTKDRENTTFTQALIWPDLLQHRERLLYFIDSFLMFLIIKFNQY